MAPRSAHAVATVYSAQVKSTDEKSILVEAGGFKPMRWFLERAVRGQAQDEEEPPKKKRKVEIDPEETIKTESDDAIPMLRVTVDFHFPETLNSKSPSQRAISEDVEFEDDQEIDVVPYAIDTDDAGTRIRLSSPASNQPVLFLECTAIPKSTVDLLRSIAAPGRLKLATAKAWNKDYPASLVSCTLTRSVGQLYTVVRLQAELKWRPGVSAFPAGAPVGKARVYPDYDFLLQAYTDDEREAFDHTQAWTPQDFYESVHVPSRDAETDDVKLGLLESDLYPFQKRAVSWMLRRERSQSATQGINGAENVVNSSSSSFYKRVLDLDGQICFVNHLQGMVTREDPGDGANQLSGGLLAEEMGLGKTVELMALISQNRVFGAKRRSVFDQHSGTRVLMSPATLIITPAAILQQWQGELRRHAPNLRVFHYQGIPTGAKKSPPQDSVIRDLASEYDVVLTTYNVLAKEVHFAKDPPERSRRRPPQHDRKRSPLVQIQWWRICLDEAQMVESGVTAAAQVACRLPRVHSWAVTGTPLRKNAQDLQGLLLFLRYQPFDEDKRLWSHLITNHRHLFRKVFNQIALRHTKAHVRDELRLPLQKRVVVTVPFSVIEQQNYATLLQQMYEDVGVDAEGAPLTGDWDPSNPSVIESMRSWLTRLRQTCLHPQVGGKNRRALGRGSGPLRTVAEVLDVMIEQNESDLRGEERTLISASLHRAHIIGNNDEDPRRSEKALAIYEEVMTTSKELVADARRRLEDAKKVLAREGGIVSTDSESETGNTESHPHIGRLRNAVRITLELYHQCVFFTATAYYQIKTNDALTLEGSDTYKALDQKEQDLYDVAKHLRRELLHPVTRNVDRLMKSIAELEKKGTITRLPKIRDLKSFGGIESRRIVEKSDDLFDVVRAQVALIEKWRAQMARFLTMPLVDQEGEENTGEEYEESTKQQDELYVYFDALKAVIADLNTLITGETAPLIDHEIKMAVRSAKLVLDPDTPDEMKPQGVHAPELALKLFGERNSLRARFGELGTLRGLIQEARNLESATMDYGARSAEHTIVQQHLAEMNSVLSAYRKALNGLEKEKELFGKTQNQRVEFYRQLQELSDAVAPYKDELDPSLDQQALTVAMDKEEEASSSLAQLRTKNRFLLHLKDETGSQAGPKVCIICTSTFERGVLTICGHQFCKECIQHWFKQARSCPMCKRRLGNNDLHDITYRPQEMKAQEEASSSTVPEKSSGTEPMPSGSASLYTDVDSKILDEIKAIDLPASYGTKIDTLAKHMLYLRESDPGAKAIVFSQYREFLDVLGTAFKEFRINYSRLGRSGAAEKFRNDPAIDCLLLDAKTDSSGLTLVNATHVFICEPLIQTAVELQAIARVHRIGQTRQTTVWMYLIQDTVEEAIYELSVARRLAHVQSRQGKSRASTLQENAIDAANSEELQSAPLTKLLVAGKSGGEVVSNEDLWQCLFGKAQKTSAMAEQVVSRHLRAEAAESRRDGRA